MPIEPDPIVLKETYERLCSERDRLRAARGFFSRPLGPAPASAGISTTLVAALGQHHLATVFIWIAVGVLLLLVLVGIAYDGKPAYRHLYARELAGVRGARGRNVRQAAVLASLPASDDVLPLGEWYQTMIERERAVMGKPTTDNHWYWPWFHVETLQQGVDLERTGLRAVQMLWFAIIVLLILAVLY